MFKFLADAFYAFLKFLVLVIYRVFYSKITVINKEHLSFKNAAIVISNHPSTLMDPLSVGSRINRRLSFLANAGLFKNAAFGAFLKVYCIPVERPKDVDGRRINNADSFARADEHLANNGAIYIAAEGTSVVERRLRNLKTGTARIALSAESKKDFSIGVTIIPVGLTYTTPLNFRGEVLLNVGEPVHLDQYKSAYEEHPFKTSKKLTADLQDIMKSLVFHTEDEAHDQALTYTQTLAQSENPMPPKKHFLRSKKVLNRIHALSDVGFNQLKTAGDEYFQTLKNEKLQDLSFFRTFKNQSHLISILKLIIGLPLFLYGYINNIFAFSIPWILSKKINIFHGYKPTIMVMAGLIFIPLFFYIQTKIVSHFIDIPYIGWIYFFTLLPMGWIAWEYRKIAIQFSQDQKAKNFKKKNATKFENLKAKRDKFKSLLQNMV